MGLNKINLNDKNIICIYQNNSKYLFNIIDLVKIIETSLTNSYLFFSEPVMCKNPYNNLAFNKSNLYNIYLFIKMHTNIYSELLFKFFKSNFDLTNFTAKYEYLLREYIIENHVNKSNHNILYKEINMMLCSFNIKNTKNKILIHNEFPKEKLVKIMKPYLLLYTSSLYSLVPIIKNKCKRVLKKETITV